MQDQYRRKSGKNRIVINGFIQFLIVHQSKRNEGRRGDEVGDEVAVLGEEVDGDHSTVHDEVPLVRGEVREENINDKMDKRNRVEDDVHDRVVDHPVEETGRR